MKKLFIVIALLLATSYAVQAAPYSFSVAKEDINRGWVIKKIWLQHYSMPKVQLDNCSYEGDVDLPADAVTADATKFDIVLGKERKRPFALLRVSAYVTDARTQETKRLRSFTAVIAEQEAATPEIVAAKATATNSVLATGNWYKISVTNTGLYKIDYNLLNSMGVNPATIVPANIRVFGNGGNMLAENNAIPRANDLTENAIWVNDGGDGRFDQGDYIVFYAVGPTAWMKDSTNQSFRHQVNLYEDKAYYFINFDAPGLRINTQSNVPAGNVTVTDFNDYASHESDLVNIGRFGKQWWGEEYGSGPGKQTTGSFPFDLGNTTAQTNFRVVLGSRSAATTNTFKVSVNGNLKTTLLFNAQSGQGDQMDQIIEKDTDFAMQASGTVTISLAYYPSSTDDRGFLDYIEINTRRDLGLVAEQLAFRDWKSVGAGKVASYQLKNAGSNTQVWDVTNPHTPVKMNGSLSGSVYTFTQDAAMLHEFIALNGSQLNVPEYVGKTDNQNLHGSGQVDMIIVTAPDFLDAANQFADFHRQHDNMRVMVATTSQVYNEFSSGSKDICAIRDLARLFYDRAGMDSTQMPRYLLLLGDASYDYKNRTANNADYVPVYESEQSHNLYYAFYSDDFYGILDDNENINNIGIANTLDIGVGRLPVNNMQDATAFVNKVKHYKSTASLGPWRLGTTFVADDEDGAGRHLTAGSDPMTRTVTNANNIYNHTKVYADALPSVSSPGGARCPQANKIINDQVYKGCFFVNYSGHGNPTVWSGKRILTSDDYNKWNSFDHMPFMVTATCEFGQFDQPSFVSAGEAMVLKNNGGVIAALTTTQLVYADQNHEINEAFLRNQFTRTAQGWNKFGDALRIGKNETYQHAGDMANFRKFALLGDPALTPDFPEYTVVTDSVRNTTGSQLTDSINALGSYMVYGSVRDNNGNVLTDFNGKLSVAFYDKPKKIDVSTYWGDTSFQTQSNIIYKGKSTVTNGQFSYTFIAPKDINYDYGKGKLSSYADNGITDAAGADTNFTIGGYSDNPVVDNDAPIVKPYIGDSLFKDGGITGPNTLLYVSLADETGINVSGNSVGHDLTAVLDGNIEVPYVLNDYYETEANTYKKGHVYFPLDNLAVGKHTIVVKAWDVSNNSGEGTVNFEVVDGGIVKMQDLMNYPNPFKDVTHFFFEHNHPYEELNVEINIYSTAGVPVRKIRQSFTPSNSRSNEITWDGTGDGGAKLPAGVYVYRINIATATGSKTSAYQKLVLLR